jgi:hypothetical protein
MEVSPASLKDAQHRMSPTEAQDTVKEDGTATWRNFWASSWEWHRSLDPKWE